MLQVKTDATFFFQQQQQEQKTSLKCSMRKRRVLTEAEKHWTTLLKGDILSR